MKKILYIFLAFLFFVNTFLIVQAVDCAPKFRWDFIVDANCTWPWDFKVYWDIIIGDKLITVPDSRIIWIDLNSQKVTFTTWGVRLEGDSKIVNAELSWYYIVVPYSTTGINECPPGYTLLNMQRSDYHDASIVNTPPTGNMYCWK